MVLGQLHGTRSMRMSDIRMSDIRMFYKCLKSIENMTNLNNSSIKASDMVPAASAISISETILRVLVFVI